MSNFEFAQCRPLRSHPPVKACSCTWELAINIFPMDLIDVACALGAAALFGASTPAAKLLLRNVSPLMLAAPLYLSAAFALTVYRFIGMSKSREAQLTRGDIRLIIGIIFFGGMLGPVLMLMGLRNLSALAGSLLLNLEAPFTALIATSLMREHLGGREALAAAAVMTGALLISVQPGYFGGSWIGAVEIAAACLSWGIDNNLTQRLSLRDPIAIAWIKASGAGLCMLVIAMLQSSAAIAEYKPWPAPPRWELFVTAQAWCST